MMKCREPDLAIVSSVFKLLSTNELLQVMKNKDTSANQKLVIFILTIVGLKETCQMKSIGFTEK